MRPKGFVTITKITLADGKEISTQQAIDYGWIGKPKGRQASGWGLERHEIPLGENLFVDNGRQMLTYAFGFRTPVDSYVCKAFGVGTGITPARVTDVALEAPITLSNGKTYEEGVTVDYPAPYTARVSFTLATTEANGCILSEMGLFTVNGALLARKIRAVSINKSSEFSPTITWRIRI